MRTYFGFVACSLLVALSTLPAFGQSSTDLFQNAIINSTSGTLGESPDGIFGGPGFGPGEDGNTLFSGVTVTPVIGDEPVHFIEFQPLNGPVRITSITGYFGQDGESPGGNRAAAILTLIADTNGTPGFQPTDDFVRSSPINYTGNVATVTLPFDTTASSFRLELDPYNSGPDAGVRIYELDAVPEPGSVALLVLGGGIIATRRRRKQV